MGLSAGLGAAAAVPVTTEGPFATGTASPITAESEGPGALVRGTVETNTLAADVETVETILTESPPGPSFPPGAEPNALVTAASEYGSTPPALTNVTKPFNTPQDSERGLAAPTAATTAAAISAQHPAVTPEAELDVTLANPDTPLGTTPLLPDMKENISAVTREGGEDLNPITESLPTTPSPAQPTAGSPVGTGVTVLPSQGLTTAMGVVEEGVTLPLDIQSEDNANFSSPRPSTAGPLTAQQDRAVSGAVGITPEPVGEMTPAAEESLSASVPGDAGDAVNGEFSPAASTFLPLESPTVSGTVGNLWEPSLLPGQAVLSPTTSLAPAGSEDGDGQGTPRVSLEAPGSTLPPAASKAPKATEDTAVSLLAPRVPTDVLSSINSPVLATALPKGDMGAVHLAKPSLQPAPWQILTGEQPPLPAAALPFPRAPGAAYPPPGTGSGALPAADDGTETPASPNLTADQGAPTSSSLGGSQPWEVAAGGPQDADGTGLNSAPDTANPASFVPDGLAWPAAGVQGQGAEGAGDTAQSGGPGNGSPYADTQRDMNPSAFSTQQDLVTTGELPAGLTEALANAELSPLSGPEDRAAAGAVPPLRQGPLPGPAPPGSAGLEPGILGAEGPGHLPGEPASAPGAAYPPLGGAAGPVSGAETPVSPDLGAAQGAPVPPSFGEPQPLGMAPGAPQGPGLPGANGPSTGLTLTWDGPTSAAFGPAGPPSPALRVQLGTNVGLPAAGEHGAGPAEQALGGAGSGTGFEPPLLPAAGSGTVAGMGHLPGAGSSFGPATPAGAVLASSISDPSSLSASGALPPSLGAGPEVPSASEGAGEAAGDGGSLGQSQAPAGEGPAGSGAPDGEMRAVLQSASSSPSAEESSSPGTAVEAANGASLPAAGGGLSTDLEAAGPEEHLVPASGIQSSASLGLPDAKLSQANVVELPGGSSVNGGPSPGANLGEGAGAITQRTSGALAPSALTSPWEVQPLVPVAPASSGISNDMATSTTASVPLSGHGLSSGLAPNGNTNSAPGTQSGSRPLMPGAQGGLAGDAGGAQTWSLEDETASGVPAPLGEVSPRAPASPGAALALPSAPQREGAAEGESTSSRLSAPLPACESAVGSSAGRREDLGAAAPGGPALLLPARQTKSPGVPSGDADTPVPGETSAMLPGEIAERGDMARLLPSTTGARVDMETTAHSPLGGSPGLPGLPSTGITAGSPTSKTLGPGPLSDSSSAAVQPFLGSELTTSLVNRAPATGGSSLPTAFPGQGGARAASPATTRTATTSLAPPVPIPGDREALPGPEAATVISRASSPVFPAPPKGPAAAPTPFPGPAGM